MPVPVAVEQFAAKHHDQVLFSPRGSATSQPDLPPDIAGAPLPDDLHHESHVTTDGELALKNDVVRSPRDLVGMKPVEPADLAEAPCPDNLSDMAGVSDDAKLAPTSKVQTGPRATPTMQPDVRAEESDMAGVSDDAQLAPTSKVQTGTRAASTMQPDVRAGEEEDEDKDEEEDDELSTQHGLQGARSDTAAHSGSPGNNEVRHGAETPVEAPGRHPADAQHVAQVISQVDTEQGQGRMVSPAPAANLPLVIHARSDIRWLLPDCAIMMIVFSTAGLVVMIVAMAIEELVNLDQL
eukprot:TRINITY_DN2014_c0_g1_i1.p1 TRINITY_DN2014_c0_g1~~TRINITY_DN2014_c0_g1_i1.p1  ORF type:complete len:295 (+),score=66.47 TRINITY_DN2014_c0_g1_i1:108-992(+)